MNNPLILTFDIGTQSMRGMLIDKSGNICALVQETYKEPYYSRFKDWAEQKPEFYYETLCLISNKLKNDYQELFEEVIAVTLTVFRDSVICLDKERKPLTDLILWLDKREVKDSDQPIGLFKKILFKLVGVKDMVLTQHNQSVCNYLMTYEKEIWDKCDKYVTLPTYLNYRLTGNLLDSDANQIGHIPFDYKNRKWLNKGELTRCIYDIPNEKLCNICKPGETIGAITLKVSEESGIRVGLPLIATGSDKGCETIGLSVITKNKAAVSFGTSATIQFCTKDYFEPKPFCPAYPAPVDGLYNPETQIYRGYWMISWFKKNFAKEECEEAKEKGIIAEDILNKHLDDVPAGSDGLILQPFWSPGVSNPNAKGAIVGWSDVHGKYHLYRAIVEGINYGIMDGLFTMSKRGKQTIDEIYVGGGGSKSDEICQITANMLGLPVKRIQTHEACGLGSSIIAFVSLGFYDSLEIAISNMVRVKDTFMPDQKEHELYLKLYHDVYNDLGKKLEPYYKNIKKILGGK